MLKFSLEKKNLTLFYIASFFSSLLFIIPVWVAFYTQYLTFTQLSIIMSGRFLVSLVLELPTGTFADMFGRKISVFIGSCVNFIALLMLAFSRDAMSIFFGLSLMGIGDAFSSGAINALVFDFLKSVHREKEYPKIMANANIFVQMAIIISSMAAGYLYTYWKGLPFLITGVSLLISGLIILTMDEKFTKTNNGRFLSSSLRKTKEGIQLVFKKGAIRNLSTYFILVGGICLSWQMYFNQIYATRIGYDEIEKGWLFAVIRLVNMLVILRILSNARLIKKYIMFIFFPVLMILATFPSVFILKPIGTTLLMIMTFSNTLREIVLGGYVNEVFESNIRATALSTLNMFVKLMYLIAMALSGSIIDRFGVEYVYVIMGILILLFILPKGIRLSHSYK